MVILLCGNFRTSSNPSIKIINTITLLLVPLLLSDAQQQSAAAAPVQYWAICWVVGEAFARYIGPATSRA